MKWISVKDRLPENQEIVDIFYDGQRETDYIYEKDHNGEKGNNFFEATESGFCCVRDCTHWMPLPGPPKDES